MSSSQSTVSTRFETVSSRIVVVWIPEGVSVTISPSSRYTTWFVWRMMAETSEASTYSESQMPTTSGLPCRAPTILLGSSRAMTAMPYVPVRCWSASATARSRFPSKYFSIRWAITSVSVSVVKRWPSCSSFFLTVT